MRTRTHYVVNDGCCESREFNDLAEAVKAYREKRAQAEASETVSLLRVTSETLASEPGELPPVHWVEDDPTKPRSYLIMLPDIETPRGGIVYGYLDPGK